MKNEFFLGACNTISAHIFLFKSQKIKQIFIIV